MIDCSDENCLSAYKTLCGELEGYSADLANKPHIVLCNKIDVDGAKDNAEKIAAEIKKTEPDTVVLPVSVAAHIGMNEIRLALLNLVSSMDSDAEAVNEKGEKISNGGFLTKRNKSSVMNPTFMETRSVDDFMEVQYPGSEN